LLDHEIDLDRFSITDRILQLADVLREKQRLKFEDLFEAHHSRSELIVTFLALLEMTRLRMTRLLQTAPLDPIYVELAVADEDIAGLADAAVAALQAPLNAPVLDQAAADVSEQPETEPE
jgi:segregation and condensation protein A